MEIKQCKGCNELFEATAENFYKNNRNGLNPYCKKCWIKRVQKRNRSIDPEIIKGYCRKQDSQPERKEIKKIYNAERRKNGKQKEWQERNPEKLYIYGKNKQNHKINNKEWLACKEYFNNECSYCGLHISDHFNMYAGNLKWTDFHKEHVDHEGENDLSNCVPSCKSCNSKKHTYSLEEWFELNDVDFNKERLNKINKWINEDYKVYID